MQSLTITPGGRLTGEIRVPGDKSISHRALMLGAVAEGESRISGFLTGEDCQNTARALEQMGVEITGLGSTELTVKGVGLGGLVAPRGVLDLGNSGTSIRLFSGLLAGQGFGATLTGDEYLRKRPMDRVVRPLTMMGADISGTGERHLPPLRIGAVGPGGLKAVDYASPIASAQVKSAVLLAGLYAEGETSVTEPAKSRDHTERMLRYMGADVEVDGLRVSLRGGQSLTAREFTVPGDVSAAAFFLVAAAVTPGSDIVIRGVGVNPTRTGIIDILRLMNADITVEGTEMEGPESVADIRVVHSELRGIEIGGDLLVRAIDEFPIICIAAACAKGETVIRDASELRVKESDRIAAMAAELAKLGAAVTETTDGAVIEGGRVLRAAELDSHGDHRVAMAMAVAGLVARGAAETGGAEDAACRTVINDTACIDTSFPGFAGLLEGLRAGV